MAVKSGKLVIVGAGKVGDAVLNAVLRMNIMAQSLFLWDFGFLS